MTIVTHIEREKENGNEVPADERKGIKGRSLLLNIDRFEYVIGVPTEYMHSVALGLVKRLLELSFSIGENRSRQIKRQLTPPTQFNEIMKTVKMFRECSRRARKLDLAVMKAQEMRNILLFFFTVVTECLKGHDKEIKVWEMLAFMIRACILPENEFSNVNKNQIKYCQKHFYNMYEQVYGTQNCTYSVHVVTVHLLLMRHFGPLTETSAFKFEAFYAELRQAFQPGTVSVLKQMLQSVMLKRMLSRHVCSESIYFSEKDTALECNSLIYIYENNEHVIYKIQSIINDELTCNQLGNFPVDLPNTQMLNWSSVRVYRKGGLSSENVVIRKKMLLEK